MLSSSKKSIKKKTNEDCIDVKQKDYRVIVKFVHTPSKVDVNQYLEEIAQIYKKKKPFIILYNALNVEHVSFDILKMQAKFMRKYESDTRKYMIRAAIVVRGPAQRLLLATLFNLRKPACPLKVFDTLDQASNYLREVKM